MAREAKVVALREAQTTEVAASIVEERDELGKNRLILSSGVEITVLPMPDAMVQRLYAQYARPVPPIVHLNVEGREWDEENKDDPQFERQTNEYMIKLGEAMTKLVMLKCVRIESYPKGFLSYEEDHTWQEDLEVLGIDMPTSAAGRRLEWMRLRVAPRLADINAIQALASKLSGVDEAQVQEAVERFQRSS
jgi:hypothetical protein